MCECNKTNCKECRSWTDEFKPDSEIRGKNTKNLWRLDYTNLGLFDCDERTAGKQFL